MRIIFINRGSPEGISGGTKKFYRCAEMLAEEGLDAWVWQRGGVANWISTRAKVLSEPNLRTLPGDILVLPEVLDASLVTLAKDPSVTTKVLFCQNQYYLLNYLSNPLLPGRRISDLGFAAVFCPSKVCADFVSRVFHQDPVHVVPSSVDPTIFAPASKRLQIACAPRKMGAELNLVRAILVTKYPESASVPWVPIHEVNEAEVARILGESAIYFSTSHMESLGIFPLEAMSAGCAVVGFHGYGGLEYATTHNGRWFGSDDLEEAADALHETITAYREGADPYHARVHGGFSTVAQFRPEATRRTLLEAIRQVLALQAQGPRVHRVSQLGFPA